MSPDQRTMLFGMFQRIARAAKPASADQLRSQITVDVFGATRSWSTFKDREVDRMKVALQRRIDDLNLDAIIADEQFHAHDQAQAKHVPVVHPGRPEQRRAGKRTREPRQWASRYEMETDVDDPGRRKRRVYWISRLFAPAYIRRIVGDLCGVTEWETLPMSQLSLLRDTLKNRLGKWLTKHKETYHFGFSIASRNPRSTTGLLTNEDLIGELLQRGICLDLSAAPGGHREHREKDHVADAGNMVPSTLDPVPDNCPF